MTIAERKIRIQEIISKADSSLLRDIELLLNLRSDDDSVSVLNESQLSELSYRRKKHMDGTSKSHSWSAVKHELINKYGFPAND